MPKETVEIEYKLKADKAGKQAKSLGDKLKSSGLAFGAVAGSVALLGKSLIGSAANLEQYQTSFEVMLGSAEKAKDLLAEINEVASATPFEQTDIIKATQKLLAFGVAQKDVIGTFKVLGDMAQGDAMKLEGLAMAYGKVQVKGKASMEELNMVAEKGVPIFDAIAEQMGIAKSEVIKMSSAGKISAEIFNESMASMTEEGGIFFQSMVKQSKTMTGLMSTVSGNVGLLGQQFGMILLPAAKKVALALNKLIQFFMKMSPSMKKVVVGVVAFIGVFAALMAGLAGFVAIAPAIAGAWVLATGPIGLTVAAVVALGVGFAMMKSKIQEAGGVMNFLKDNLITLAQILIKIVTNPMKMFLKGLQAMLDGIKKMTGGKIDLSVEGAIEAIDSLDERLDEFREKKTEDEEMDREAEVEGAAAKFEEDQEMNAERAAVIAEQEKAKAEQDKAARALLKTEVLENDALTLNQKAKLLDDFRKKTGINDKALQKAQDEIDTSRAKVFNDTLSFMAKGMQSKNKEIFEIGKASSIAQATMSTYEAVVKALAGLPPPLSFIMAGATLVVGLDNINRISQTQFQAQDGAIVEATAGGTSVNVGEAGGSEAIIPLDEGEDAAGGAGIGGEQSVQVFIDGREMAKEFYETNTDQIRTGEIQARS